MAGIELHVPTAGTFGVRGRKIAQRLLGVLRRFADPKVGDVGIFRAEVFDPTHGPELAQSLLQLQRNILGEKVLGLPKSR